ncbi:glutaredoxin family protein [Cumulibacter manganitolerans]|uniref:glutaredoxin family protein n=1 Tax=Cumulibacter manganitolerans TaxID=1884992 RepID=UPI001298207F|nr:glutaredoxin family protein [Cumulibacter manganitolerans]
MQPDVTLMSRRECHLCEVAQAELARILPDYGLQAEVVDVDTAPELRAEYGDRVPVLLLNGKEHGYFTVDEHRLRPALDALMGR